MPGYLIPALAAAFAMILTGATLRTRWRRPAAWLSLAALGQAAALQCIDAGILIHYQHYRPLGELLAGAWSRWLVIFLAVQALCVAIGLARRFAGIRAWLSGRLGPFQVAAILAAACAASAALSRNPADFVAELLLASVVQLINIGNLVLVALTLPRPEMSGVWQRMQRLLGPADSRRTGVDKFALG